MSDLDDYEEGSWTPTMTFGLPPAHAPAQVGVYTKIDKVVYVHGYLRVTPRADAAGVHVGWQAVNDTHGFVFQRALVTWLATEPWYRHWHLRWALRKARKWSAQ